MLVLEPLGYVLIISYDHVPIIVYYHVVYSFYGLRNLAAVTLDSRQDRQRLLGFVHKSECHDYCTPILEHQATQHSTSRSRTSAQKCPSSTRLSTSLFPADLQKELNIDRQITFAKRGKMNCVLFVTFTIAVMRGRSGERGIPSLVFDKQPWVTLPPELI